MTDTQFASGPTEPRPADEVPPLEEPDTPNTDPDEEAPKRQPRTGVHVLERGETPASLARRLYGRPALARVLVAANPEVKWREGAEIKLPEVN